jgi:hypothetical protein
VADSIPKTQLIQKEELSLLNKRQERAVQDLTMKLARLVKSDEYRRNAPLNVGIKLATVSSLALVETFTHLRKIGRVQETHSRLLGEGVHCDRCRL